MERPLWRESDRELSEIRLKKHFGAKLTETEKTTFKAAEKTLDYFEVYDATESTNRREIFYKMYLDPKSYGRTLLSIAGEVGYDVRSLIMIKKKLLAVFAYIADKLRCR